VNNFDVTDMYFRDWKETVSLIKLCREAGVPPLQWKKFSNLAAIAQKDYVCYLAQQRAGAWK
jgi:hypothetical protein